MIFELSHGLIDMAGAATPSPQQPIDDDKVSPGWIGLLFLVVMGAAVVFLIRNMNSRLRNIDVDRHRREQEAKGKMPPREDDAGESVNT